MVATSAKPGLSPRQKVIEAYVTQGAAGLLVMLFVTFSHRSSTTAILERLGADAPALIVIFFFTTAAACSLWFQLTEELSVALELTAGLAMYPLLGPVLSSWIIVAACNFSRFLAMRQIGFDKTEVLDRQLEYAKNFGFFGTFGLPVVTASVLFEVLGAPIPVLQPTVQNVFAMVICGLVLLLTNSLIMVRPAIAYGYSAAKITRLYLIDFLIYVLTLPFAICISLSFGAIGWGAVLGLAGSMIISYAVARKLARARQSTQALVSRLASLTTIGKSLSLTTKEDLLTTVYDECRKLVDTSLFTIALYDEKRNELSFELDMADDSVLPRTTIPVGEGLNSWVILKQRPLLIRGMEDERKLGVVPVDDGIGSQAWLGVPMIARDRVIGVISIQSYRKNAFTMDDLHLLEAIANQAAVALDNAKLYEDLENLTYELEDRVEERTLELRDTHGRLVASDHSKNEFLAKMSHELRTPLNSIIGFSSVLLHSGRTLLQPRLYKFLENIHTAGTHLLDLINDILDLSKIEAGKVELRLETFDPRDTIASVERVMKGFASDARVRIIATVHPEVPRVRQDEGRLKQILFNLLSNAVKFSPAGGIVQIDVAPVAANDSPLGLESIRIQVSDNGVGIAPEEVRKIFEEFYQTDQGRQAPLSGTGLGLSLTRNFVELHHGTIDVQSAPGRGSVFTLHLPVDCGIEQLNESTSANR